MGEGETDNVDRSAAVGSPTSVMSSDDDKKEKDIIIAPIQVIIRDLSDDEEDEDEEDEEEERQKRLKKKKGPKSNKKDKTMLLMRSFGQAIKLINEQKVN